MKLFFAVADVVVVLVASGWRITDSPMLHWRSTLRSTTSTAWSERRGGEARQPTPMPVVADRALYRISDTVLGGSTGYLVARRFFALLDAHNGLKTGSGDRCECDLSRPIFMPVASSPIGLPTHPKEDALG